MVIYQKGEPVFPFGPVTFEVSLQKSENKLNTKGGFVFKETNTFFVDVYDDGRLGDFKTEWDTQYFKITFCGEEQSPNTIIIPLNESIY